MDISTAPSLAERSAAVTAPPASRHHDGAAPKRDRRLTLTKVDRRSRLGIRIRELTDLFTAAIGDELTPLRKLKIEKAALLTGLAELAQGDYARDGKGALKDVLLAERRAATAVRALGISDAKPRPPSILRQLAEAAR
jgi:hypothetical protein